MQTSGSDTHQVLRLSVVISPQTANDRLGMALRILHQTIESGPRHTDLEPSHPGYIITAQMERLNQLCRPGILGSRVG